MGSDSRASPNATCDDGVCSKREDMFDAMRAAGIERGAPTTSYDRGASTGGGSCPLDVDELGRASWALLHTMAAHYPDVPTATQRVQARRFFDALGDLYPCATCRADFRVDVDASPPRVDSRASLSRWVCERHNEVNAKLGKPLVSCALRDLDERWRHSTDCSHHDASPNDADA